MAEIWKTYVENEGSMINTECH